MDLISISDAATGLVAHTAAVADGTLGGANWDIGSFLGNANKTITDWGSLLLKLLGVIALIWGGVLLVKKLMGNPQTSQQTSWITIGLLILVGGAFLAGGFAIVKKVGSGGKDTIFKLGEGSGSFLWDQSLGLTDALPALAGVLPF